MQIFFEQSIFFFFFSARGYCYFLSKTTVDIFVIQFHSIDVSAVTKWILCIKGTSVLVIVKFSYFTWLIFTVPFLKVEQCEETTQ